MGNKNTCSRAFVDEKYTRPQGIFDTKELDGRKLRRLILNRKLAPCFPGADECTAELDECPICLLAYPSLNRWTCCSKPICTECYLRMKLDYLSWSMQCPFCKTLGSTVEYHGAKTAEERRLEQAEEQKVIETMIRIHQNELHDEKKVSRSTEAFESQTNHTLMEPVFEVEPARPAQAAHMQESPCEINDGEDLDLEDMMLMEAIWLSMQEQDETFEDFCLAQQTSASSSVQEEGMFHHGGSISTGSAGRCASTELAAHGERPGTMAEGSVSNQSSQATEACASFSRSSSAKSPATVDWWNFPEFYSAPSEDNAGGEASFEDQIMMAMALSLAEAVDPAQTG